jgi:hypothetical protein
MFDSESTLNSVLLLLKKVQEKVVECQSLSTFFFEKREKNIVIISIHG